MRKLIASFMLILVLTGLWPAAAPAFGATLSAGSRAELVNVMVDQFRQRNEVFSVHYMGSQDLSDGSIVQEIGEFDGTAFATQLQSAYGFAGIEALYTDLAGEGVRFDFLVDYDYSRQESNRLHTDLQQWVDTHLSRDMNDAVKAAVVTRFLSDHMLYVLDDSVNNAYDGYYGKRTACSGYAELATLLLQKSGVTVKYIGGHIPPGLTDTAYLNTRFTAADFRAMNFGSVAEELQNLHVWNMVQIAGNWYHLDPTWVDGDSDGKPEAGGYNGAYFLGGDRDFARNHIWIQGEYPVASQSWWNSAQEPLRSFLAAYLETRLYDYPQVTSLGELNAYAESAYQSGRGSQAFRITQGVQPYDAFPALGSALSKVASSSASYRAVPTFPGDGYVLTLAFKGRDKDARESLPAMKEAVSVERGMRFSPANLIADGNQAGAPGVKWLSLSPELLGSDKGQFTALQPGRGYIGAYTRDEAVIIPVVIAGPPLRVVLNGEALSLDPSPMITNGRTLVPLRGVFEAMGITVAYNAASRTITSTRGNQTLLMTLGDRKASLNGREILLDVPPRLLNDRAFVPARFIAESFGADIEWDGPNNRVLITQ